MSKNKKIVFEETLSDTDYGLIICSKTGRLKGIWIPENKDESIPYVIVELCRKYFGIDPNEDDDDTLH
tara:strand:- start:525 stop:728 length:204 start_codon:yes stop_codon:yes gene_type:complete